MDMEKPMNTKKDKRVYIVPQHATNDVRKSPMHTRNDAYQRILNAERELAKYVQEAYAPTSR